MLQHCRLAATLAAVTLPLCSSVIAQANAYVIKEISQQYYLDALDISTGGSRRIAMIPGQQQGGPRDLVWGGPQPELWAITGAGTLGTISTVNGAFTLRFTLPLGQYDGIAWSPTRLEFWLTSYANDRRFAHAWNPLTRAFRTVGELPIGGATSEIEFDGAGNLWSLTWSSSLFIVDQSTLSMRLISNLHRAAYLPQIDRASGAFYALGIGGPEQILRIDPATGTTTPMASYPTYSTAGWVVVPGVCLGLFLSTGSSCPGTGSIDPILDGYGCYGSGGTVHLSLRQAMSGATGILLFGLGPASIPLGNGCSLNIGPVFTDPIIALPLFGTGGAGQGFTTVNFTVPQNTVVSSLALQALVFDVGAPGAFSATNGLRLIVE